MNRITTDNLINDSFDGIQRIKLKMENDITRNRFEFLHAVENLRSTLEIYPIDYYAITVNRLSSPYIQFTLFKIRYIHNTIIEIQKIDTDLFLKIKELV